MGNGGRPQSLGRGAASRHKIVAITVIAAFIGVGLGLAQFASAAGSFEMKPDPGTGAKSDNVSSTRTARLTRLNRQLSSSTRVFNERCAEARSTSGSYMDRRMAQDQAEGALFRARQTATEMRKLGVPAKAPASCRVTIVDPEKKKAPENKDRNKEEIDATGVAGKPGTTTKKPDFDTYAAKVKASQAICAKADGANAAEKKNLKVQYDKAIAEARTLAKPVGGEVTGYCSALRG